MKTTDAISAAAATQDEVSSAWMYVPGSLAATIRLWVRRHRTRRALARLGPEGLADIGIDAGMRARECRKRLWRA